MTTDNADLPELRIPGRGRYDEGARRERLAWLRDHTGAGLAPLDEMRLVAEQLSSSTENAIGAVEIPVGIAGPLLFAGEMASGVIFAPLATSEGALVASATRGAAAITRAGGVRTRVVAQRMIRVPAFKFATVGEAFTFAAWVVGQLEPLRAQIRQVSRHAELRTVEPRVIDSTAHIVFLYTTGDAAGQNMTTTATAHACQWIHQQLPALGLAPVRFLIEGYMNSDKKVSLRIPGGGRGCAVVAECTIDGATLARNLKVSTDDLLDAWAIMSTAADHVQVVTRHINIANIIAGIFAATGQDIACVHESSLGELEVFRAGDGVGARLSLRGLAIGTVGGGTHFPAQRALLEMMGCAGSGTVRRLAEIIAGYGLALDISTLAAVTSNHFAGAHERLGRNQDLREV